ncbi:AraC family transcriptional regulator [Planotetraspora kaengkrachanensis]|uniref:AraC family transcriptional regulator n=1 Tax=Planotetraspora kaengkrachanensis TaxID=575193 RepID=A0A8J3Q1B9_9ACTN|nr:AraC family transcriptional regulator [Planotetraspora kaengkrachanensis]GIG84758.1 AraC family transcriptional regulator [Planotetraspora kaengkrachanensis]
MDALSHVLSLLNVESAAPSRFEVGGPWALRFPGGYRHAKFGVVLTGSCWISPQDAEPAQLRQGDCWMVTSGGPYVMSSDLATRAVDAVPVFLAAESLDCVRYGDADVDTVLVGGALTFDDGNARLLLDVLPPLVHVPASSDQAEALHMAMRLLNQETAAPSLGSAFMTDRIVHMVFVQALRTYAATMAADGGSPGGWLSALLDPQIGGALRLMHEDAARKWTVGDLATSVGMSRSTFAEKFKTAVGATPLDYLMRWRMHAAGRELRDTDRTVHAIAGNWGYGSESSFSNAFKRVMGASPRTYRRRDASRSSVSGSPYHS